MSTRYRTGDRIRVTREMTWAHGVAGTIAPGPNLVDALLDNGDSPFAGEAYHLVDTVDGPEPSYWVILDTPQYDADGDGPYKEAEFLERDLEPLAQS